MKKGINSHFLLNLNFSQSNLKNISLNIGINITLLKQKRFLISNCMIHDNAKTLKCFDMANLLTAIMFEINS